MDSTVCLDEGIDELADFCGAGEAVAELTSRSIFIFLNNVKAMRLKQIFCLSQGNGGFSSF